MANTNDDILSIYNRLLARKQRLTNRVSSYEMIFSSCSSSFVYSLISICQQCHQSHDDWAKWLIQTLNMTGSQLEQETKKVCNGQMNQQFDYAMKCIKKRREKKKKIEIVFSFEIITRNVCHLSNEYFQ